MNRLNQYKELIKDLQADISSPCFGNFYKLFNFLLQDAREKNDVATIEETPKLQGEIRLLKGILKDITPNPNKPKKYDGGFGE